MQKIKGIITGLFVAAVSLMSGAAFADTSAADTAVSGAITAATASVTTYATGLVGLATVGVAFMVGIKYIKKVRGAA